MALHTITLEIDAVDEKPQQERIELETRVADALDPDKTQDFAKQCLLEAGLNPADFTVNVNIN